MFVINNNIAFSSHLIWIRREIWADQALFTNQESPEQFPNIRGFWSERTTGEGLFFTGGSIIMEYGLISLHKMLID